MLQFYDTPVNNMSITQGHVKVLRNLDLCLISSSGSLASKPGSDRSFNSFEILLDHTHQRKPELTHLKHAHTEICENPGATQTAG